MGDQMMHVPHNPNRPVRGPTAEERRLAMLRHKIRTAVSPEWHERCRKCAESLDGVPVGGVYYEMMKKLEKGEDDG